MSDNYTYSRPYGEAAFKMALEANVIDQWSDNPNAKGIDPYIRLALVNPF